MLNVLYQMERLAHMAKYIICQWTFVIRHSVIQQFLILEPVLIPVRTKLLQTRGGSYRNRVPQNRVGDFFNDLVRGLDFRG